VTTDPGPQRPSNNQPSLVPGMVLLIVAAVLIVVVLVRPSMPGWLRAVIAIAAVCVVLALLIYAFYVFRATTRRGGPR
jgi:membrane protein YdbS with pleckstrin-like domain